MIDTELALAIQGELDRQRNTLELIASENIVSKDVMWAAGNVLTNKYAEGLPGKRYYGGCEYVDKVEQIAINRACKLFNCNYANVQPHSGSNANLAVYIALLNPGDTILSANLQDGAGHLSHGSPANISGKLYNIVSYGVGEDGRYDYDEIEQLAIKNKPKMIVAGASAYSRLIDYERMRKIADEVGAYLFADMAHIAGLVAAGLVPSPVPYADVTTTTTHKTLRGPRGAIILWNDEGLTKKINSAMFPGLQGGPLEHIIAAKAVCFHEAMQPEFVEYQKQVIKNAKTLAEHMKANGFNIVTGGTDNHMFLVDLQNFGITGKEFQIRCDECGITLNKNTIPHDPKSPFVTSGVRIGTPAITSRGLKEDDMIVIAELLKQIVVGNDLDRVKSTVQKICKAHPIYDGV